MRKSYDPRMHSAEHILNQTMVRLFNCGRSFSAHIEKKKSKCDYHFSRNLTSEEIFIIETKGREDLDDIRKIKRLVVWCNDVNSEQSEVKYIPLYIEEDIWKRERNSINTFEQVVKLFTIKSKL